ncbi:flagellar export chaperone FliS [Sphingomonas hengshuiensis]|uniref:Flagellar biosynthesis protein FliS n=1 Tax=Sphingomonas hengshuiensis TaxID=1609977 RepID=A0A7U4JAZ3_9SPHN|nr:flagellar protein FliS [Sphingomonas hengshuiensis]AJP73496.1 flagellar biosynthesis protein FliS [Sphingomonas hengshuiensis]
MTRYASTLAGNPAATYRRIDIAGRTAASDPHALVGLLYEEGAAALRAAAWATEKRQFAVKSERIARATSVLFALEAGLDFERGGAVSRTLATFYHGLRQDVVRASLGTDPQPFRDAATSLDEIAGAWAQLRG